MCASSPQQTAAHVPPPRPPNTAKHLAPSAIFLISGHLQQQHPPQVHAHAHASSKPSVTGVVSVCPPRQQKTTHLPWARMTCCAGRHIWPHAWGDTMQNQSCKFPLTDTGVAAVHAPPFCHEIPTHPQCVNLGCFFNTTFPFDHL